LHELSFSLQYSTLAKHSSARPTTNRDLFMLGRANNPL